MERVQELVRPDGTTIRWAFAPAVQPAAGRLVVLLHGLASNRSRFAELVEATRLRERFDLLRVDLRGHGESLTRGAIGLELWCDDLAAVIEAVGHPRAVVVGHSLGAQVALAFHARQAERTAALGLIDPVFRPALRGPWRLLAGLSPALAGLARLVRLLNRLGVGRRRLLPLDLRALDAEARAALESPDAEAAFVRRYSSTWADLRTFHTAHYLAELVELFRPAPPLAAIDVPVLVLLSRGGTFTEPAAMRRELAALSRARVIELDCQHWPLTERPVEVRTALELWCDQLG